MPEAVLQRCKAWREKNQDLLEQEGVSLSSLNLGMVQYLHPLNVLCATCF